MSLVSPVAAEVDATGAFKRKPSSFRNWISREAGAKFPPEANRYHLYVSLACPWAHRTLITRAIKGLAHVISYSVVHWRMFERGWTFDEGPGVIPDSVNNASAMRDLYHIAEPNYDGRYTVPVLWDKTLKTIVNNESSEIIRMLSSEFNEFAKNPSLEIYPEDLRHDIDTWNDMIYPNINDGVYRCGFARSQGAYEEAFDKLFSALDTVDGHLATNRYLVGKNFTEADIRLFTTLVRFDPVYFGHFKCNLRRIIDYPNLYNYLKELYQMPHVKDTVDFQHIKGHYYESHKHVNPTGIVPKGPAIDLDSPHDRARLEGAPVSLPEQA
eukprot:GILK01006948.1.p1 GENE.GILK01006948.1~~GILK01006948.1.p1  ORF type:complete len:343 (+),score=26.36 GILK01006948.1:54-1031(+)